jgi:hypothetical protein
MDDINYPQLGDQLRLNWSLTHIRYAGAPRHATISLAVLFNQHIYTCTLEPNLKPRSIGITVTKDILRSLQSAYVAYWNFILSSAL